MTQKLQAEQFLPLKAIRALLSSKQDFDFTEGQRFIFEETYRRIVAEHSDLTISDDPGRLAQEMQLSRREQKELKALGLAANGKVSMSDIGIAQQWIAIRDAGLSLMAGFSSVNMTLMKNVVELAFRNEIQLFSDRIRSSVLTLGRN